MDISYMVRTEWSTLLLDAEGVCVQARSRQDTQRNAKRAASDGAARCIGAQYVASLDREAPGQLVEMPRIGCPMLFAATTPDGRIYLVRTGPVTHFEEVSSGVHDRDRLPLQERVGTDEIIVVKDRAMGPGADQEMTTPFRKHRASAKQTERGLDGRTASLPPPALGSLPPPPIGAPAPTRTSLPPLQSASLPPPPAKRRHSPLPAPPASYATESPRRHAGQAAGSRSRSQGLAAPQRSALPSPPPPPSLSPSPRQRPLPELEPARGVMWSLPEDDLESDVGSSPVAYRAKKEGGASASYRTPARGARRR